MGEFIREKKLNTDTLGTAKELIEYMLNYKEMQIRFQ